MTQPNMPNLPGFEAMADTFDFVKNMWGGMQSASGIPGVAMPTLSLDEINKQITDLKAVESWLNVNMNMLRGTIQALEVQSATISTLHAMGAAFGVEIKPNHAAGEKTPSPSQNPTGSAAPHSFFTQNDASALDASSANTDAAAGETNATGKHLGADATMDATTAWWNALQSQFNQVVSSVMADEASGKKGGALKPAMKKSTGAAKKAAVKQAPVKTSGSTTKSKAKPAAKTAVKKPVKTASKKR